MVSARCLGRNHRTRRGARFALLLTAALALGGASAPVRIKAQSPPELDKTLRGLFLNHEYVAKSFGPARWLENGAAYVTVEPSAVLKGASDIVRYDTVTGKREVLVAAPELTPAGSKDPLAIEGYEWSGDMKRLLIFTHTVRVWRQNTRGDYWVLDRGAKTLRRLGRDMPEQSLMFAKLSPDGSKAAYVMANNLWVEDLETSKFTQLTGNGSQAIINGTSDWVYEEEFDVRDGFRWSPDGKWIAYWQFDTRGVQDFALLYNTGGPHDIVTYIPYPQYGLYPHVQHYGYPQPGTTNSSVRIGVVSASGGLTQWMKVPGDPRDNYIARMDWAGNSNELVLQHLNRLQNHDDVLLADAASGAVRQTYRDEDQAWVDVVNDLSWLHAGQDFLWVSERDGWRHVYAVPRLGGEARLVTHGDFDVIGVAGVDPSGEWLYHIASPRNAAERYLYRTRLDGSGSPERLTPASAPGTHSYEMSPDCRFAFHTYSTFDQPPVTDLVRLPDHSVVRGLVANDELRAKIKPLIPEPPEFFKIDVGGGVALDAWMIKPRGFDSSKKYPLLIYVYGEPAGQMVLDDWTASRGLFHRALANEGYLVASIDNRGTPAPKGRAWRKVVYGSVGVLSSKEQADALRALERTRPYIDASRVAVWGWSGGGTNTLNLIFRSPDLYKVGMAVAPVPDQRLYDTIYQERYMGLPKDNADGYRAGSAINYAEGLQGHLLIVHGSGDDNVHYQGTELLINRLIELGKPFDFMEYPGRTHAISEGPGTFYHLHALLARYLEDHLPAGPR
jgi:dipeptidyl-peptidase-4